MVLANTTAGVFWHNLISTECLTNINSEMGSAALSLLTDVSIQLNDLDTSEVIYLSNNGKPSICVSDIIESINKRIARYQSVALLTREA